MRRSGWKKGDWLVVDEESGFVEYASNVGRDYYQVLKKKSQMDRLHPQTFITAGRDPYPVDPIRPPFRDFDLTNSDIGSYVGTTNVPVPFGPASHLFQGAGIGKARIEIDFVVR